MLRRRIAPPNSRREKLLRKAYAPAIELLRRRQQARDLGHAPAVTVTVWKGLRERAAELTDRPRILVLKLDHLGDFIVALPAFAQLRHAFPQSRITLICGSWNRTWAVQTGLFDEVVACDFVSAVSAEKAIPGSGLALFDALNLAPVDLAIDLRHDPDTRMLLSRVPASLRAGFCAPPEMGGDALDIALPDMEHISTATGTGRPVHADLRLSLLVSAITATWSRDQHPARALIRASTQAPVAGRYAVLAPGAGSPIRVWPIDRLAEVGRELIARHDLDLVLSGGPAQRQDCDALAAALPADRVVNLAGATSLGDLPGVVARASLYVGYDTGTTHLAAALGVPTVAIMGGIPNPDVWHAEGRRTAVVTGVIACSSCYLTHPRDCPFGVRCLMAITPGHVLESCEALLSAEPVRA
jgi:ADP-heptose:LPS heptosyltransferase